MAGSANHVAKPPAKAPAPRSSPQAKPPAKGAAKPPTKPKARPPSPPRPATPPSTIATFTTEGQEPARVRTLLSKVRPLLMSGEDILYIALERRTASLIAPDSVVLTNRRFIWFHPKMLGRIDMQDHIWRDLADIKYSEQMLSATITLRTVSGQVLTMDGLVKDQARRVYTVARNMQDRSREERRVRNIEESRARAGGFHFHGGQTGHSPSAFDIVGSPPPSASPIPMSAPLPTQLPGQAEDPMATLTKLKSMADAGVITQVDYQQKKRDLLARL